MDHFLTICSRLLGIAGVVSLIFGAFNLLRPRQDSHLMHPIGFAGVALVQASLICGLLLHQRPDIEQLYAFNCFSLLFFMTSLYFSAWKARKKPGAAIETTPPVV
jgi:ABC-type polysaccharide/polyol phosphate export permease